jgi:chemotaxis protein CheC
MKELVSISGFHLDILKEIGNIGAGNAATALSRLIQKKVDMKVPSVQVVSLNEITDVMGGAETIVASTFFRVEGDAPGSIFFIQPIEEALKLVKELTNESYDTAFSISELGKSALQEIGNILTGSYLSALSDFMHLSLTQTVPALSIDMAGAIIVQGLVQDINVGDYAVLIDTSFVEANAIDSSTIKGYFFLLPDSESIKTIFSFLGVPYDE